MVLNGSSNWSGRGLRSDENIGIYWRKGLTQTLPRSTSTTGTLAGLRPVAGRYQMSARTSQAAIEQGRMVDGLLFGTGPINGVDPYANVDLD